MSENKKPIEVKIVKDRGEPYTAPARSLEEELALQPTREEAYAGGRYPDFTVRQIRAMAGVVR